MPGLEDTLSLTWLALVQTNDIVVVNALVQRFVDKTRIRRFVMVVVMVVVSVSMVMMSMTVSVCVCFVVTVAHYVRVWFCEEG